MFGRLVRWLVRLFFFGLIAGAVWFVVTRLLGGEDEDFDDFEDLEASFEFNETPVEIDVSAPMATDTTAPESSGTSEEAAEMSELSIAATGDSVDNSVAEASSRLDTMTLDDLEDNRHVTSGATEPSANGTSEGPRLIDIKGIGPGYEAKLHSMGIQTMNDLLHADAYQLAEQLGVIGGAPTVEDWKEQARTMMA